MFYVNRILAMCSNEKLLDEEIRTVINVGKKKKQI